MQKHQINVCLGFIGKTEEALNFYSNVFNVPILYTIKFKDIATEGIPPEEREKIARMALDFGGFHLCGEDLDVASATELATADIKHIPKQFFSITLNNEQEVDKIVAQLSEDGNIIVPFAPQLFAPYYGRLVDRYGIGWELDVAFEEGSSEYD